MCVFAYNKNFAIKIFLSYAGGTNPWPTEKGFQAQSFSDGKLEIIGFSIMDFVSCFFYFIYVACLSRNF